MDPNCIDNGPKITKEGKRTRNRNRPPKKGPKRTGKGKNPAFEDSLLRQAKGEDVGTEKVRAKHQKRPKELSEDRRFAEVAKLIKRYIPITVNGLAVSSILHPKRLSDEPKGGEGNARGTATRDVSIERDLSTETKTETESVTPSKALPKEKDRVIPKRLSKAEKLSIIGTHIRKLVEKDPKQPLYLSFILIPSDPDFPFDLALLNFNLTIPSTYPQNSSSLPSLLVLNAEISRGYAVNIERLYADIARLALGGTVSTPDLALVNGKGLLSQIQTLDKYLEYALKQEKRPTMKFVTFRHSSPSPSPVPAKKGSDTKEAKKDVTKSKSSNKEKNVVGPILKEAQDARNLAVERMCAKLASVVRLFHRSTTEERYKVLIPCSGTLTRLPKLWRFENELIDVFISIPANFPDVNPKANIATNFSNNLMVAKRTKLEGQGFSLLRLVEEARVAEKNFRTNIQDWLDTQSLVTRADPLFLVTLINWIANNLQWILLSEADFVVWKQLMLGLQTG